MQFDQHASKIVEFSELHNRSSHWFSVIVLGILSSSTLRADMYLQQDGSVIYRAYEHHGSKSTYEFRIYPDGTMTGQFHGR